MLFQWRMLIERNTTSYIAGSKDIFLSRGICFCQKWFSRYRQSEVKYRNWSMCLVVKENEKKSAIILKNK